MECGGKREQGRDAALDRRGERFQPPHPAPARPSALTWHGCPGCSGRVRIGIQSGVAPLLPLFATALHKLRVAIMECGGKREQGATPLWIVEVSASSRRIRPLPDILL